MTSKKKARHNMRNIGGTNVISSKILDFHRRDLEGLDRKGAITGIKVKAVRDEYWRQYPLNVWVQHLAVTYGHEKAGKKWGVLSASVIGKQGFKQSILCLYDEHGGIVLNAEQMEAVQGWISSILPEKATKKGKKH